MDRWYRLCVDVTGLGEVLGISAERHEDGELTSLAEFGRKPDEPIDAALERCRRCAEELWGVQLTLWP